MSCSLVKQRICHLMLFALLALVMVISMTTVASAASVNTSTATGVAIAASAGVTAAPAYGGHGYTPISFHRGPVGYYPTRNRGRRWGCVSWRWSAHYRRTVCYRSGWIYY